MRRPIGFICKDRLPGAGSLAHYRSMSRVPAQSRIARAAASGRGRVRAVAADNNRNNASLPRAGD